MERAEFIEKVTAEVDRAYAKHGKDKWGRHEFFGIILEEFEEMKAEIFKGGEIPFDRAKMEKEIIQVAAMALRYLETGDRYEKQGASDAMRVVGGSADNEEEEREWLDNELNLKAEMKHGSAYDLYE